ncbi:MAG: 50S ribosomal protein L25/general stress protein Ctc [Coxiellaceae bacterium]|nr:50S ribosomal protein L25/general stress protein Ctc [Coxiellaceae bacterium]
MSNTFELNAETRANHGKANSRRLRRLENKMPAVVYGGGQDPVALTLSHKELSLALENEAMYSHILTLNIDGKAEKVVLKDLQRHPYKPVIMHADFLRIKAKEKLNMNVPIHYMNEEEAPGVKEGGVASHLMTEVEIRCLPANLPEYIEVNVAELAIDSSLHLSDIKLPEGVEFATELTDDSDQPIVSIHKPRAVSEETEASAEEGEAAEGDNAAGDSKAAEGDADNKE